MNVCAVVRIDLLDTVQFLINTIMYLLYLISILITQCSAQMLYTKDFHYRVEAGERTCFFESARAGQMLEVYYQVLDGQHGELDIALDVITPDGTIIAADYKKSQNSIIRDIESDGDYAVCLDNTYSVMNHKLVFLYIMLEDASPSQPEAVVTVVNEEGKEVKQEEALHWMGTLENGDSYYVEVEHIADSLSRTLKHVVSARHMLDLYSATKSRDSYSAFKDTHKVDTWSAFQISLMCFVGLLQVYMIKNLFKEPSH